ncbi:MAG: ATP-binding protein [Clostridiales bacterium]|jgi:DNA replication protein DnaC|nr:ATP-binding protein [Clostridiales bacterium]OPZ68256.1 MAG: Primosomal protein DnaI [Firmicutes bacterium ADurb.Bin467]
MTRAERVRSLLDEYIQQQRENAAALREREREAYARDPALETLRGQTVSVALDAMRDALQEPSEDKRRGIAEKMRARGLFINGEVRRRLRALGLPEDYLEEQYRCPLCRDTGYVGDAPARFCECFERRLAAKASAGVAVEGQTFDRFNPFLAPEENGQREKLMLVKNLLEEFADRYPDAQWQSIVLMGAGGLGKSFLLNCVHDRVARRGFAAQRATAFRMFEAMRARHMGQEDGEDGFCALLTAPLLLIDDLGTEPVMRNITVEYLFMLLNERIEAGLSTMVTTNLAPPQLLERYGERVVSRLFDRARGLTVRLEGRDLRLYGRC